MVRDTASHAAIRLTQQWQVEEGATRPATRPNLVAQNPHRSSLLLAVHNSVKHHSPPPSSANVPMMCSVTSGSLWESMERQSAHDAQHAAGAILRAAEPKAAQPHGQTDHSTSGFPLLNVSWEATHQRFECPPHATIMPIRVYPGSAGQIVNSGGIWDLRTGARSAMRTGCPAPKTLSHTTDSLPPPWRWKLRKRTGVSQCQTSIHALSVVSTQSCRQLSSATARNLPTVSNYDNSGDSVVISMFAFSQMDAKTSHKSTEFLGGIHRSTLDDSLFVPNVLNRNAQCSYCWFRVGAEDHLLPSPSSQVFDHNRCCVSSWPLPHTDCCHQAESNF